MANKEIIAASIQVDAGDSVDNVKGLKTEIKGVKEELKQTGETAKNTGKDIESSAGSFGKLKDGLSKMPGPLGQAAQGVSSLQSAFKALLANPVGLVLTAIVATLALLYKAFTNTFAGAQKIEQAFAGIGAVGQSLLDNLTKIGSAIVKVFSFDFSGAIDDIKDVAKEAEKTYTKMAALTKEAQALKKEQLQNDLEAVDRQAKLADLREKASDGETSLADRKKALQDLRKESEENAQADLDLAKRVADNKIAQLTLQKDGELKNAEEINKIRIEQRQGEIENANELRRINKEITKIDKEEEAQRKEIAQKAEQERKERVAKSLEARKAEAEKIKQFNAKLNALTQENVLAAIKNQFDKEEKALEQKYLNEIAIINEGVKNKMLTIEQARQLERQQDEKYYNELLAVEEKRDADRKAKEDAKRKEEAQATEDRLAKGAAGAANLMKNAYDKQGEQLEGVVNDEDSSFKDKKAAIDAEIALDKQLYDQKLITEEEYNKRNKEHSEARKKVGEEELNARMQQGAALANMLDGLSELVGKQTALGKGFAIASATIATFQSAVSAFNSLAPIPIVGPALGGIAAAAAVAAGIANVKKIVAVKVPGQGNSGSAPSASSLSPAAPLVPTQQSTRIDTASIKEIGDATSGRAYVLSSDISKDKDRNERLNRAARLAG